jgi:Phosphotransferase enzyme family
VGEEALGGAGLTQVTRVGDTVRRATSSSTPAVHLLLRHLEAVGFDGAPRLLGIDERGREVLSFLAGGEERHDDRALVRAARLIRRYHDAISGFRPPPDAPWNTMVGAPVAREIVCHNDLSPANAIYDDQGPYAFVDWDLAAPGSRVWDLAYALWRFAPLYPDEDCARLGFPSVPRGPRIRLFCDAYGFEQRLELLDTVARRQRSLYETARAWGSAGRRGWAEVWRETRGEQWLRSLRYLQDNRSTWEHDLAA